MPMVATIQGINEKILSLNFADCKAEIRIADAQKSFNEGVTVLVTRCLTGKHDLRKFAESFFLAPQGNGYFVLNDVFRYQEVNNWGIIQILGVDNIAAIPPTTDSDPFHVPKMPAPDPLTSAVEKGKFVAENAKIPSDTVKQLVQEKEASVESHCGANEDDIPVVRDSTSTTKEDTPKKSYASILKVAKGVSGPTKVYVPTTKVAPRKPENQSVPVAPPPEPAASVPCGTDILESSSAQEEGEGHSIYIRNLLINMTPGIQEIWAYQARRYPSQI